MGKWRHRSAPLCPELEAHYVTLTVEGEMDADAWAVQLNDQYAEGYRLRHVVQLGDRTIQVFEHFLHRHLPE